MVAGGAAVAAQEAFEPRPLLTVVAIHVTDYAHLSPLDLANAEAQATETYRAVDIDIVWSS